MKLRFMKTYNADEINNSTVNQELINCMKDNGQVYPVAFGVDLNDPAKSFIEGASRFGKEADVKVYHCCYEPENDDDIAVNCLVAGCQIGSAFPFAFAIHYRNDLRIDVLFSNISYLNGKVHSQIAGTVNTYFFD